MTDEERMAIERLKSLIKYSVEHEYFSPFLEHEIDDFNLAINLINKYEKAIDRMTKYIYNTSSIEFKDKEAIKKNFMEDKE